MLFVSDAQLSPNNAVLSSTSSYPGSNCIDGITSDYKNLCGTPGDNIKPCQWLALQFQEQVEVFRVDIYNRIHKNAGVPERIRNLEVRLTYELPTSADSMFTEGQLLGTFAGPGRKGQIIKVEGPAQIGRYVLIQMNYKAHMAFHEVKVYGRQVEEKCQNRELNGSLYRGKAETTEGGLTCRTWTSYWTSEEGLVEEGHNYCRAPGSSDERTWCYFSENGVSALTNKNWEYCALPMCGETGEENISSDIDISISKIAREQSSLTW